MSDFKQEFAPVDALQDSPLRRLPPEIRLSVFRLALRHENGLVFGKLWLPLADGTPVSQPLNLRATCREIHRETEGMFFAVNDTTIIYKAEGASQAHVRQQTQLAFGVINKICTLPSLLPTATRPRVIIQPSGYTPRSPIGDGVVKSVESHLLGNVRSAKLHETFRLAAAVAMSDHWCCSGDGFREQTGNMFGKNLCIRDVPVLMKDCFLLSVVIPLDCQTTASSVADSALRVKLAALESHRKHRAFPVAIEVDRILRSLETTCGRLQSLIQNVVATPPDTTGSLTGCWGYLIAPAIHLKVSHLSP